MEEPSKEQKHFILRLEGSGIFSKFAYIYTSTVFDWHLTGGAYRMAEPKSILKQGTVGVTDLVEGVNSWIGPP